MSIASITNGADGKSDGVASDLPVADFRVLGERFNDHGERLAEVGWQDKC